MKVISDSGAGADVLHAAWVLLDEAQQVLLRAESVVMLLGFESDAPAHHAYAADVAGDLLRSLKKKLSDAQALVCTRGRSPGTR